MLSANVSLAARLAALPEATRREVLSGLDPAELAALTHAWDVWRRPDQTPPEGDWRVWLLLAGRGAGKTWTGSQLIRAEIESGRRRSIALVAPTHLAGRKVMIEGPSGILSVCPPHAQPTYEVATGRLTWPNGGQCHLLSSETPDRARGFNFDGCWADELCSWESAQDTWDQVALATRVPGPLGHSPQIVVTTTPKAIPLLKAIMAEPTTRITRASTFANSANLDPSVLAHLQSRYGGTSLGRQELMGELITDAEGALWNRALLERTRVATAPAQMTRVVVAIDPAGTAKKHSDETGIIVAGRDREGNGYVIADLSGKYSPEQWARRAIDAYRRHRADRVIAEQNFGGAMVEATLRAIDRSVSFKPVVASRGKAVRAEPVLAKFEKNEAHVVGSLIELEDQLCEWEPNSGMPSPDRLDAMVWALSELLIEPEPQPIRFINFSFMGR